MLDKKIKLLVIAFSAMCVVGLGVTGYIVFHSDNKPNTKVENTLPSDRKPSTKEKIEYSEIKNKDGNGLTQNDKKNAVNSDVGIYEANKIIIGNGNKEFPKEKSNSLLAQLKVYASNIEYQKIIDEVKPYLNEYRFSLGENQKIATMYNDASLMLSTQSASDVEKGVIAKAMRNVEMKVVGSLMLPEISREQLIKDQNSLDPIITGKVNILSDDVLNLDDMATIKDEDKDIVNDIVDNCDNLLLLNKVKINVDKDYTLKVYVVTNMDGTVDIYGFYPSDSKNVPYQTVSYWKEINKKLYN